MKSGTSDEMKGKFNRVKGKVKEEAGALLGNREMEADGKDQKHAGAAQEKVGQVKKVFGK
jgi:uncharacterized protein YjbJ (UPF0337 family)